MEEKFAPVWLFHPDEVYFPVEVPDYIRQCDFREVKDGTRRPVTLSEFTDWVADRADSVQRQSTLIPAQGIKTPIMQLGASNPCPVYYSSFGTREDLYINYYLFYANNPAPRFLCGVPVCCGSHYADIEHVQVHVQQGQLRRVYYSKHGGGNWVPVSRLHRSVDGRPWVYVSRGSHACYETNGFYGFHCRFAGLVPDWTSLDGIRLLQSRLFPIEGPLLYRGDYGDGAVAGFPEKASWRRVDEDSSWRCG